MADATQYRPAPDEGLTVLSLDQKRFFDENGYLVLKGVYSPEEVSQLQEEMNVLLRDPEAANPGVGFSYEKSEPDPNTPVDPNNPKRVWMIFDTPLAGDFWLNQIREPRIVNALSDLLGPNINFHNGKARIKPPGYESHQIWHQDWPYERHSHAELAAAIIYLDDTEPGAAATEVVPGSHLRGELTHDSEFAISDETVGRPGVPICAKAGDVAIIHVLVVHKAGTNTSDANRSCIINEYKTAEAEDLWGNKCAYAELPLIRDRRPVQEA